MSYSEKYEEFMSKHMKTESSKYKTRLTIIAVILIISTILGAIAEKETTKKVENLDKIIETIQGTTEEQYKEEIEKAKADGEKVENIYETKQKALETMQTVQAYYAKIYDGHSKGFVIILFTLAISGSIIAIMMYLIFTGWIIKKIWSDITIWMSVLMRILVLIILFPTLFYPLISIGVFGQLPFVLFTLYKYIKTKRAEDKDDIIKEDKKGKKETREETKNEESSHIS